MNIVLEMADGDLGNKSILKTQILKDRYSEKTSVVCLKETSPK